MSNWSELVYDLLVEIVGRIQKLEDFIFFGAVCKGWSRARKKENFKGLWLRQDTPYLMLPIRNENDDIREFYGLVEGKIVDSIKIPKFKDRRCLESLGWLLAIGNDGSMCLLDPFSKVEIPVPHQTTFPAYDMNSMDEYFFVQKMVLSARPSETSDFILMIIWGSDSDLAYWRPGDELWNIINNQQGVYTDVMYHGGYFYATGYADCVWIFAFEEHNLPEGRMVAYDNCLNDLTLEKMFYILKTSQSLFIISRDGFEYVDENNNRYYDIKKFQVYEVDMSEGTWTEINNLGSMAIFVGNSATFAVDSSRFSGEIKGNHIYFTDDGWEYYYINFEEGGGEDMGVYSIETGTIESIYSEEALHSKTCVSIWITPSF